MMIEVIAWILIAISVIEVIYVTVVSQKKSMKRPYDALTLSGAWIGAIFVVVVCGRVLGWW